MIKYVACFALGLVAGLVIASGFGLWPNAADAEKPCTPEIVEDNLVL